MKKVLVTIEEFEKEGGELTNERCLFDINNKLVGSYISETDNIKPRILTYPTGHILEYTEYLSRELFIQCNCVVQYK